MTVEGRSVPVRVSVSGSIATAEVDGRKLRLEFGGGIRVNGAARAVNVTWLPEEEAGEGGDTTIDVRPPMPGRIVRVLAKSGDAVKHGAPLFVLEAMKMQNEIPAPVSGVVREVRIKEGDAVAADQVLLRMTRGRAAAP